MWGIVAPLLLVGGAALFFGYKKWFGKWVVFNNWVDR